MANDIRSHPLEDCPVCQEIGDWANCEDTVEWIEAHETLREIGALSSPPKEETE